MRYRKVSIIGRAGRGGSCIWPENRTLPHLAAGAAAAATCKHLPLMMVIIVKVEMGEK